MTSRSPRCLTRRASMCRRWIGRRPVRRLLSVHLRRLDEEQSHSGRPGALERLRQAARTRTSASSGASWRRLAKPTTGRNATQQKIGDYFAACMDEAAVEKLGATPLQAVARRDRRAARARTTWPRCWAASIWPTPTEGLLFGFGSDQDFADSTPGDRLRRRRRPGPARPRLLHQDRRRSRRDPRRSTSRTCRRCSSCSATRPAAAKREAATVMAIETALAKASLTRVERRDPYKLFHKMTRKQLAGADAGFRLERLPRRPPALPSVSTFNVTEPEFYKAAGRSSSRATASDDLEDLSALARRARQRAPYLSAAVRATRISISIARLCAA